MEGGVVPHSLSAGGRGLSSAPYLFPPGSLSPILLWFGAVGMGVRGGGHSLWLPLFTRRL